jgi:hypothetical protein
VAALLKILDKDLTPYVPIELPERSIFSTDFIFLIIYGAVRLSISFLERFNYLNIYKFYITSKIIFIDLLFPKLN